ncbi:hypothetical protein B0H13DRAFT_2059563 [Mycena leptocephala]|nr:hypothetical protein B0H13DRAFT_2059563 [Mycena leptocephala]
MRVQMRLVRQRRRALVLIWVGMISLWIWIWVGGVRALGGCGDEPVRGRDGGRRCRRRQRGARGSGRSIQDETKKTRATSGNLQ